LRRKLLKALKKDNTQNRFRQSKSENLSGQNLSEFIEKKANKGLQKARKTGIINFGSDY